MRIAAIIAWFGVILPTAASAQVNYVLLAGPPVSAPRPPAQVALYPARVVNLKDNKYYACEAYRMPNGMNPIINCSSSGAKMTLLKGNDVVTIQAQPNGTVQVPQAWWVFWQINQTTGEINFCDDQQPPANACGRFQVP
jgi:hypothetical protein